MGARQHARQEDDDVATTMGRSMGRMWPAAEAKSYVGRGRGEPLDNASRRRRSGTKCAVGEKRPPPRLGGELSSAGDLRGAGIASGLIA